MRYFLLLGCMMCGLNVFSQKNDSLEVMRPINNLFEGMRRGDSSMVRSSFHKNVRMHTSAMNKEGQLIIQEDELSDFLIAVGTPHSNVWDEKIWNVTINLDNGVAQVWCDYGFFIDDKFSHCGVDAFHLIKEGGGWLIIHLMDTRKKENCYLPKER